MTAREKLLAEYATTPSRVARELALLAIAAAAEIAEAHTPDRNPGGPIARWRAREMKWMCDRITAAIRALAAEVEGA